MCSFEICSIFFCILGTPFLTSLHHQGWNLDAASLGEFIKIGERICALADITQTHRLRYEICSFFGLYFWILFVFPVRGTVVFRLSRLRTTTLSI